ncbi:MAG: hypothetical protein R2710_05600 [Acidimicrobiales bacterium]
MVISRCTRRVDQRRRSPTRRWIRQQRRWRPSTGVATGDAASAGEDIGPMPTSQPVMAPWRSTERTTVSCRRCRTRLIIADGSPGAVAVGDDNDRQQHRGSSRITIGDGNVDSDIDVDGDRRDRRRQSDRQGSDDVNAGGLRFGRRGRCRGRSDRAATATP